MTNIKAYSAIPQWNELKEITGVSVHRNTVGILHNVLRVETVNNVSGQYKLIGIFMGAILVQMLLGSGSNVMLILMVMFNNIKTKGQNS